MKILKRVLPVLAVILLVLVYAAPLGPVPGFFIGGNAAAAPAQWPDTSSVHEIRLRVPGTLPRVVIIWVIQHEGELYVAGARDSGWVSMLANGGPVAMRLGDDTYALNAVAVTDGWEPILEAYKGKYRPDYPEIVDGMPSLEEAEGQVAVYRLSRS